MININLIDISFQLITNGFNLLDAEMNTIGTGIYLGVSVTDHSCDPNAVATFDGITLNVRAIEDIESLDWSKVSTYVNQYLFINRFTRWWIKINI